MSGLYSLYKKINHLPIVSTLAFFVSDRISGIWNENRRYVCKSIQKPEAIPPKSSKLMKDLKIAYVCDEMTYKSFHDLTQSVYITPWNWYEMLENEKPDLFFCESAWSGIAKYKDCWRGRIYKSDRVKYNNRKVLFQILEYCNANGIPTVFWNKEDPTYFGNTNNDFIDTALHFDYIFTTAEECVEKYKKRGAKNVFVLPFGFSPKLFNPMNSTEKENRAVFAGSWYPMHTERCRQMRAVFDEVLKHDIMLQIYDRNSDIKETLNIFPEEYKAYVHDKIPFEKLGEEIKKSHYGININTVVNSSTMFARRVYEMMACNVCIISNESQGIKKQFPQRVWFAGEDFDVSKIEEICRVNVQEVLSKHTNESRLKKILEDIGYPVEEDIVSIAVVSKTHKGMVQHENLLLCYYETLETVEDVQYVIVDEHMTIEQIQQMLVHYQYLEDTVAIGCFEGDRYGITDTDEYQGVLFPISRLNSVKNKEKIAVYCI